MLASCPLSKLETLYGKIDIKPVAGQPLAPLESQSKPGIQMVDHPSKELRSRISAAVYGKGIVDSNLHLPESVLRTWLT